MTSSSDCCSRRTPVSRRETRPNRRENKTMIRRNSSLTWIGFLFLLFPLVVSRPARAQRPEKDYLSDIEADKIRDAESPNERVKLFLTFAEDRLKKFQYELEHPSPNKHTEMLNYLMNSYGGCVDDAADIIQVSLDKQENIRHGIDLMASKAKEFL